MLLVDAISLSCPPGSELKDDKARMVPLGSTGVVMLFGLRVSWLHGHGETIFNAIAPINGNCAVTFAGQASESGYSLLVRTDNPQSFGA